jgi:UDP-glucose 4-epimerase
MKYVITGGSGYIGGRLTELLSGRDEVERIVNLDVKPPPVPWPRTEYVRGDVRDRVAIQGLLEREQADVLIHLAFVLNPLRDEARMYDIDVNGTQAVLQAASEAGVRQVLVTSSASAYGAFPDNPRPIAEDWPVRGASDFAYARDKADADRVCQLWAAEHPDRTMTIVRPAIVFGPNVDNYLVRVWENAAFLPIIDGVEAELQLIHEDDVVSAIVTLLDGGHGGAFNVAADGTMGWGEGAELVGLRTRTISMKAVTRIYSLAWRLRVPRVEAPAGNLRFLRHPWVVSNEKLKATGWEPTRETREIFMETMRVRGALEPAVESAAAAPAS